MLLTSSIDDGLLNPTVEEDVQPEKFDDKPPSPTESSVGTATELEMEDVTRMEEELKRLLVENLTLKSDVEKCQFSYNSFVNNDAKVKLYTGLPSWLTLSVLFNFISNSMEEHHMSKLTKFQKVLIVLMRLKLNVPVSFLADLFRVSNTTISSAFTRTLHVLCVC